VRSHLNSEIDIMTRRTLLSLALVTIGAAAACGAEKPNIVFIFTDDQASWALGASGHPHAKTPHMDRLVREGAHLVNSFTVTPVCSPSRASLMTSQYGTELGITDWIHPRNEPKLGLAPTAVTWPELLKDAGYQTGLVGKWHLGVPDQFHPTATGFDYFMGFREGGTTPNNPVLEADGKKKKFTGLTADVLTDHALQFVRDSKTDPFLLCLHYRAPHARWLPVADEDWEPFANLDPRIPNPNYPKLDVKRVKRMTREYLASVHSVDRNVGRLLGLLDDLGLARTTIVIFTSDHGYNMGHNGIWHKGNGHWVLTEPPPATENVPRNQRPNMYDHSLRVPTIVRWPGAVRPGTVVEQTVTNLDWFPTLLAMGGVRGRTDPQVRGRDLSAVLRGAAPQDWENDLFGQYSTHHQSRTHMRMYRTQRWKLVRDFRNPQRDELFDLQRDPAESINRISDPSPTVQKAIVDLDEKLRTRMREIGDPALP
jgi:uncharacterized sulfatase